MQEKSLTLFFLHGLLGSKEDWQGVIQYIQRRTLQIKCIAIDLPFHGKSQNQEINSFEEARHFLQIELDKHVGNNPYWLVGYSLGGRLALDFVLHNDNQNLQGVILESVNLGLPDLESRQQRWQSDTAWANRFENENMKKVLADWYQQLVFAHLTVKQRQTLIAKRLHNQGKNIAKMLRATSLAKQEYFLSAKWQFYLEKLQRHCVIGYFCGDEDKKFKKLAKEMDFKTIIIPKAGHNAHQENPQVFGEYLLNFIQCTLIDNSC